MARILVIDDEYQTLNSLGQALTHFGYEVEVAHDGDEGIEVINNGYNCDLVITDINMPRMNGNAVAKHIRSSDKPDTPIVAISGLCDDINGELFNFVLMKPFKLEALIQVIRSVIENH
jgi:CheY-like chemotaxis protein